LKVVLDTNVFVSGIFFGGVPGHILTAWRNGSVTDSSTIIWRDSAARRKMTSD
jgi:predicted nucleic acid-binding protein